MEIEDIKQKNILDLSKLSKYGFLKLVFEIYFFTDIYKSITKTSKIECEQFCVRLSKILAKDKKSEVIDASRQQFE